MSLGKNIHNAFEVVFETFKSIEKLIVKCRAEIDKEKYYMPTERFLRNSNDSSWSGWIYWSFILLFQRKEDGKVMDNGWINAPVYAVEINVDSDTCAEPELIVAKMIFKDMTEWSKGCLPSNHAFFYDTIHANDIYEEKEMNNFIGKIAPMAGYEEDGFWGFKQLHYMTKKLVDVNQYNYKEMIFGTIEELSKVEE